MAAPTRETQIREARISAIQVEWLMTAISTELKAGYPARLAQRPTPRGSRWLAECPAPTAVEPGSNPCCPTRPTRAPD